MKTPKEQGAEEYMRAHSMFYSSVKIAKEAADETAEEYEKTQTFENRIKMEICKAIYHAKYAALDSFCKNEDLWPYRPQPRL